MGKKRRKKKGKKKRRDERKCRFKHGALVQITRETFLPFYFCKWQASSAANVYAELHENYTPTEECTIEAEQERVPRYVKKGTELADLRRVGMKEKRSRYARHENFSTHLYAVHAWECGEENEKKKKQDFRV